MIAALSTPSRLGKYEVLRPLARGGMAEILLGRASGPHGFEKLVVLKRVRAELGMQFATERNRQIEDGCGSLTNVRRIVAAARKAGRSLTRDFNEVEQLQVSVKGPANFVSAADHRAEDILFNELSKSRPGYGFVMEERGHVEGDVEQGEDQPGEGPPRPHGGRLPRAEGVGVEGVLRGERAEHGGVQRIGTV